MGPTIKSLALRGRPLIGGGLAVAFVTIIAFVVLPRIASWSDVWEVLRNLSWPWVLALVAAAAFNVVTFAPPWMAVVPGLSFRPALTVTLSSTASTYLLPGGAFLGMGLSFTMLRGWGYGGRTVTIGLTVASIWNQFVIFGMPVIALALLIVDGGVNPLLGTLAWVGLAVVAALGAGFAASLYSVELAQGFGDFMAALTSRGLRLVRRGPVGWDGGAFVRFRLDARELLGSRWHVITITTLVAHLSTFVILMAALRAAGIPFDDISMIEAFAAWSLVRVLGSLPIVPGGFGVVELALTTALVGFGASNAGAVATALLYRVVTTAPPLILGAAGGATWRRHHPQWQTEENAEQQTDASS